MCSPFFICARFLKERYWNLCSHLFAHFLFHWKLCKISAWCNGHYEQMSSITDVFTWHVLLQSPLAAECTANELKEFLNAKRCIPLNHILCTKSFGLHLIVKWDHQMGTTNKAQNSLVWSNARAHWKRIWREKKISGKHFMQNVSSEYILLHCLSLVAIWKTSAGVSVDADFCTGFVSINFAGETGFRIINCTCVIEYCCHLLKKKLQLKFCLKHTKL